MVEEHSFEKPRARTIFRVGEWQVDPLANSISRDDEDLRLEPKVMQVLERLAESPGMTVTKEEFMESVWEGTVVTDDVLARCISELRKALQDNARNPSYIETIRKTGYRLIAPVTIPAAQPRPFGGVSPSIGSEPEAPARVRMRPWLGFAAAAGVVLAVWGLIAFVGSVSGESTGPLKTVPFTSLPGEEFDPALSPDGKQTAFSWRNEEDGNVDIHIKQMGAETPLRLTDHPGEDRSPAWSPDGQELAFYRCEEAGCAVLITPAIGGSERIALPAEAGYQIRYVSWSPTDRTWIALSARSSTAEGYGIYLLSTETLELTRHTTPPPSSPGDFDPNFSPDGGAIAFIRRSVEGVEDILTIPLEGGELRPIMTDRTELAGLDWAPSGRSVIFASNGGDRPGLWRASLSGNEPVWLTPSGVGMTVHQPSISRQGQRLVYEQRSSQTNIWQLRRLSTRPGPLITSTSWDSHPDFSPDGERIAFASRRSGTYEIWVSDRDGTNPIQLTSFNGPFTGTPRWGPVGERVAFESRAEGHSDIYIVGTAGDTPRRLTSHDAEDVAPSWSHDGAWVYFSSNRTGSWEVWMIPATGGEAVQVTTTGGTAAQESVDGDWLYYARPDTSGIWKIPLSSAAVEEAAAEAAAAAPVAAVALGDSLVSADSLSPPPAEPQQILDFLEPYDWGNWRVMSDGIYFIRRRTPRPYIEFYRFRDGLLYRITQIDELPEHPSFTISPDGRWFLFTHIDERSSDILLIEDFS